MNQKITDEEILVIAHRKASTYTHRSDPTSHAYGFVKHTMIDFARAIEEAITQKSEDPALSMSMFASRADYNAAMAAAYPDRMSAPTPARYQPFDVMAQGRHDHVLKSFALESKDFGVMLTISTPDAAVYITRDQAMKFFGFSEAVPPSSLAALAATMTAEAYAITGWPPGLLQDDDKGLSKWLSEKPDALQHVKAQPISCKKDAEIDRLQGLLISAFTRMERARGWLTDDNPRSVCNWGVLDTEDLRAAIDQPVPPTKAAL